MNDFTMRSRILDVVQRGVGGRDLLLRHGYPLGEGFVDVLSQYQSLEDASREGRLRDLDGLLMRLNSASSK